MLPGVPMHGSWNVAFKIDFRKETHLDPVTATGPAVCLRSAIPECSSSRRFARLCSLPISERWMIKGSVLGSC